MGQADEAKTVYADYIHVHKDLKCLPNQFKLRCLLIYLLRHRDE
jgi:hypothetical protein